MKPILTATTKDKDGFAPDLSLIGRSFEHVKTGGRFRTTGYVFDADQDVWKVCYDHYRDNDPRSGAFDFPRFSRCMRDFTDPERFREITGQF